jgi:hypothetical protein
MSDQLSVRHPGLRAEPRPSYRPVQKAGIDPDMRRLGIVAAWCVGAVALVGGAATLLGSRQHGVPVIAPEAGPVRIKPADPGGMKVTGAELGTANGTGQALAPAAEQPEIATLRAQVRAMKAQLQRQAAETAHAEKLASVAVAARGAQKVVQTPAPVRTAATAEVPARAATSLDAAVAKLTVAPPPAAPAPGIRVQLAALADASAAHDEWAALSKKMPDLLARRRPEITQVEAAGRTMWRLRTGPFDGTAAANGFCAALRARGADCSVAAF